MPNRRKPKGPLGPFFKDEPDVRKEFIDNVKLQQEYAK